MVNDDDWMTQAEFIADLGIRMALAPDIVGINGLALPPVTEAQLDEYISNSRV